MFEESDSNQLHAAPMSSSFSSKHFSMPPLHSFSGKTSVCHPKSFLNMQQLMLFAGVQCRLRSVVRRVALPVRHKVFMSWGHLWGLRTCSISSSEQRDAQLYLSERQKNLLFVLGSGRSGTQLVTQLLEASNKVAAFHEPNFFEDIATMDTFRKHPERAMGFWSDFRSVAIYRRWRAAKNKTHYAEVTGTLRYHVSTIQKIFPSCPLYLLSRDGRGVVRSIMGWPEFYGPGSRGAYALSPLPGDICHMRWASMSRFERICWAWRDANECVMQAVPQVSWIQLERLSASFQYAHDIFLQPAGIDMNYDTFNRCVSTKSPNSSREYRFPAWKDWTHKQQHQFRDICGNTMTRLGYDF